MMDQARLNQAARDHRAGDREALRPLVQAWTRPLIALAYRYVGDWETARDLTQETWLRVHRSIQKWDPSRPVRPWVFGIHRNLCLDHLRRPGLVAAEEPDPDSVVDPRPDQLTEVVHRDLADRIRAALAGLGEVQRRVLVMVDLEEMKPAEVAADMGMKPVTVRTTLHFARKKLARMLRQEES
jgi:RNA polymerase sigma-70 factor (ECF subfamily)